MRQHSEFRFILPPPRFGSEARYFSKDEKATITGFFFRTLTQAYQLGWLSIVGDPIMDVIATIIELVTEDIEGQWDIPYEIDPAHADLVASMCLQLYIDVAMIFELDSLPGDACFIVERYVGDDPVILYQGSGSLPLTQHGLPQPSIRRVTDYYGLHPRSFVPLSEEPAQGGSQRASRFLLPAA